MIGWQVMLEAFAVQTEPHGWNQSVRLLRFQKLEAVQYLVAKGFLDPIGHAHAVDSKALFEITDTGRFVCLAGFTEINRRASPGGRKPRVVPAEKQSLAQRIVKKFPLTVWDLAKVPWRWIKNPEFDRYET